jgi:hypothetical protein
MSEAMAKAGSRRSGWWAPLAIAVVLPGCADHRGATPNWHDVITHKDVDRLRPWRTDWVDALAKARADGNDAAIAREGALLDPDAGLDNPSPPAGDYGCRVVRFGKGGSAVGGFSTTPMEKCRINTVGNGLIGLSKLDGPQRPIGRIYPGAGAQLTFLGTLAVGDESRPFDYGVDHERDLIGLFERIGDHRWRLVLPKPPFDSAFEIIELVPA